MRFLGSPWAVLLLAVLAMAAHQLFLAGWVVDDAAISFAYARNLATGEGLVVVPGGERVEGFSNPLWVAVLAGFEVVGIGSRTAAKGLALAFGAGAIVLLARGVHREVPHVAWVAPMVFAANAQAAIWGASGLENALFTALVLGGVLAIVRGHLTLAGLCFGGVALTRPEGLAYGLVGLFWAWRAHGRSAWRFALPWVAPFAVYEAFRWAYFAWPFPNTFYAKVGTTGGDRLDWNSRGWRQLRQWSLQSGAVYLLPVWLLAITPRWRPLAVGSGLAVVGVFAPWEPVRVGAWLLLGTLFPLFASTPLRGLCAHLVSAVIAFSLYADGDWMRGHRWMALLAGPLAILFALGSAGLIERIRVALGDEELTGTTHWVVVLGLLGALVPLQGIQTRDFARQPVDYPEMIARRLAYTDSIAATLGLDQRFVSTLEMDMGAHMLDGDYTLVDLAGLVDVPIARRGLRDRAFMAQYVFEERRPTFAHVHKHWARASQIGRYPAWRRDYIELPPYPDGPHQHGGVHVRRDVLFDAEWMGPGGIEPAAMHGALSLVGAELRTPRTASRALVRFGLRAEGPSDVEVRLELSGPVRLSEKVSPGYRWVAPESWGDAVWVGRVAVDVHEAPAGDYQAVLVLGDHRQELGTVAIGTAVPEDWSAARAGDCEAAEDEAQRRRDLDVDVTMEGRRAIADCWAARGDVAALERARLWDHRSPTVLSAIDRVAGERARAGREALAAGDSATAYEAFSEAVRVKPWDAWSRRRAEQSRP